jgi:hypothetical protein
MKARITHASYVIDFLNEGFNTQEISSHLETVVDDYLKRCQIGKEFENWEIRFRATYNNARQLLISRNKFGTFKSDKVKEITVVIPVPSKAEGTMGRFKRTVHYGIGHYDNLIRNFILIDVDCKMFSNRTEFIDHCLTRSIDYSFNIGIIIIGNKIFVQKDPA